MKRTRQVLSWISILFLTFIWSEARTGSLLQTSWALDGRDPREKASPRCGGNFIALPAGNPAPASPQANTLVLDTFTNAPGLAVSGVNPRSYMGDPFNAADPGGPLEITQIVFYMSSSIDRTFSDGLCLRIQFWDNYNGTSDPVFSNAAGGVNLFTIPGPASLSANAFYAITATLSTPLSFVDLINNGFVVNYQGDNGTGCADTDTLTSLIRYVDKPDEAPLPVGSIPLPPPDWGYYRNASGLTNFNLNSTDLRGISGTNSNAIAIKLYANGGQAKDHFVYLPTASRNYAATPSSLPPE
jgi:hypothetical protein